MSERASMLKVGNHQWPSPGLRSGKNAELDLVQGSFSFLSLPTSQHGLKWIFVR